MNNKDNSIIGKNRFRTIRNIFLVYLFTSVITQRYEIFAAICSSFPFILPVIFDERQLSVTERTGKSVLYGVPGILAAVVFMLITKSYSTAAWLVPAVYSFISSLVFSLLQSRLSEHKRTVLKCIISVSVCFLAFV